MEKWRELLAVETVVAEVAEEFGEAPIIPDARGALDSVREALEDLRSGFQDEIEVVDPDEEMLARVRQIVYREADRNSLTVQL